MKDMKKNLVPLFVALTLLYSLVYHILMFKAVSQDDMDVDECSERRRLGGIVPPQCLELDAFKQWHDRDAEELLAEAGSPYNDDSETKPGEEKPNSHASVAVDVSGEICDVSISEDLAGLEKKFSEFVVTSVHVDTNAPGQTTADDLELKEDPPHSSIVSPNVHHLHEWGHQYEKGEDKQRGGNTDFSTLHAEMGARHQKRAADRAALKDEIAQRMGKLEEKLSGVAADRKAWETTLLKKYDVTNSIGTQTDSAPPAKSAFMPKRLQWSAAIPVVHHQKLKKADFLEAPAKGPVVVSKGDVRHLHWTGKLPKVSAITWIKGDRKTRARMMYFVDNFQLQDYEGEKQLILVYHYKDAVAASIIQKHADGERVKGVAAHDFSVETFPSDPALRYAAWGASDADIIAQWDFDEWHDPNRMSLQVRAMVHASRHACVLSTMSTSHSQAEEEREIHTVSIIGERSWMQEHWHPFCKRKSDVTSSFLSGQVVELDMQNTVLMSNISRVEHVFIETAKKESSAPARSQERVPSPEQRSSEERTSRAEEKKEDGTDFSRGINECLGYDHSKGHTAEEVAEKAIRENVGEDFGGMFHGFLKRRHDITLKLQLLCFEATMETDNKKRKFMHDHVLEMDKIRTELDKHIDSMASMFGKPVNGWGGHKIEA